MAELPLVSLDLTVFAGRRPRPIGQQLLTAEGRTQHRHWSVFTPLLVIILDAGCCSSSNYLSLMY